DLIVSARKMQKPNVIANCHGTVLLTSGNKRCCAYCGNQNVHGELAAPSKGIPGGTRWRRRESGNANPVSAPRVCIGCEQRIVMVTVHTVAIHQSQAAVD